MHLRSSLPLTLLFLACATPVWSQQAKEPADILPANVLASVEVRQPGPLAREIAALFKGCILGNAPDSLAGLNTSRHASEELGIIGSFLSPEMVREASRIRGAAAAITGIDKKNGIAEFVVVVLPGDSNVPGFAMRAFLTGYRSSYYRTFPGGGAEMVQEAFEPVDTVEGVKIYHTVRRITTSPARRPGEPAEAPKVRREVREREPALAMMPGALLLGTPSVVKDVIERIKGKSETAALSSVKAYQEARRQLGDEPGLFAFANPARIFPVVQQLAGKQAQRPMEVLKGVVNPKAIRSVAASVGLKDGNLHYRVRDELDPDEKCPLLELLPGKAVASELLHVAPRDALFFAAISNDRGGKRWQQLLELADKVAEKVHPDAPAPSRKVAEMEEALKIKIGPDLIGRIADAAFAVGGADALRAAFTGKVRAPKQPPVGVILRATSEDDAKALVESVLPKVVAALSHNQGEEPAKKEIDGQEIYLLPAKGDKQVCYGRQGETIVLGPDAKVVAAWLKNSTEKAGLLTDEKVAAEVKKLDEPVAVAMTKPMLLAGWTFFLWRSASAEIPPERPEARPEEKPATPRDRPLPPRDRPAPPLLRQKANAAPAPAAAREQDGMMRLLDVLEKDSMLVAGLTRKPDHLQLEARYSGLRKVVPVLVDMAVLQASRSKAPSAEAFPTPRETIKPVRPSERPRPPDRNPVEPPPSPDKPRR